MYKTWAHKYRQRPQKKNSTRREQQEVFVFKYICPSVHVLASLSLPTPPLLYQGVELLEQHKKSNPEMIVLGRGRGVMFFQRTVRGHQ